MTKLTMEFFKPLNLVPKLESKLECISYILYPIQVKKQLVEVLINLNSEVNMINPDFIKKLGLRICKTKVGTQKIDSIKLDSFGIVIASFLMEDKQKISRFFEETFLLADISMDIALNMPYFTMNNVEIDFVDCHIYQRI